MKLLPFTNDFVFKAIFGRNPDILLDLLNSFPEFAGDKQIQDIQILNPEIPKDILSEKLSILDIHAVDKMGNKILIEMQSSHRTNFTKRILYYWAKLYSKSLKTGEKYETLPKVYMFNFLNFNLLPQVEKFHTVFHLLEKNIPNLRLTDDLEIHIIELKKCRNVYETSQSNLEKWLLLLRDAPILKGGQMKTLAKKNVNFKKAISELKTISYDEELRNLYEIQSLIADLDHNTRMSDAFDKGWEQGIEKGIEKGIEQGIEKGIERGIEAIIQSIEILLETKFQSEGLKLLPKFRKIKDLDHLQQILLAIKKAKTLSGLKKTLKL